MSLSWFLIGLFLYLGALIQGAVGFGFALVAAPLIMLFEPQLIPGAVIIGGSSLTLAMCIQDGRYADLSGVGWILVGLIPGMFLGGWALMVLPPRETALMFSVVVLLAVGLSLYGFPARPIPHHLIPAGLLSAFMNVTTTMGGPPLALIYQNVSGPQLRGTLAVLFLLGNILSIISVWQAGKLGMFQIQAGLIMIVPILLGLFTARRVVKWLDRGHTRAAVLLIAGSSALIILVRAIWFPDSI
ncbi:MAG: sulfite exporter TauE/SafE family protein [Magnetococcales bacterium]|nr:sulfite exporter TauE/SafE family protein [Magnetococcales bacterium]